MLCASIGFVIALSSFTRPHALPHANQTFQNQRATLIVHGFVVAMPSRTTFDLALRNGRIVRVDGTAAFANGQDSGSFFIGRPLAVSGNLDASGLLHAVTIERAEDRTQEWPPDGRLPSSR